MQESYFEGVDKRSDCYKYLKFLYDKKQTISNATRNNIDEITKFYLTGYKLAMNARGDLIQFYLL